MKSIEWNNEGLEWQILWDYVNGLAAWNTWEKIVYCGAITGSEFETYAATKIYIAKILRFDRRDTSAVDAYITLYNEANAAMFRYINIIPYWDGNYKMVGNTIQTETVYFSRLVNAIYTYMYFIGYRLTIV